MEMTRERDDVPNQSGFLASPTGRADGPRKVKLCHGLHSSVDFQPFPGMFQGPSKASGPCCSGCRGGGYFRENEETLLLY